MTAIRLDVDEQAYLAAQLGNLLSIYPGCYKRFTMKLQALYIFQLRFRA